MDLVVNPFTPEETLFGSPDEYFTSKYYEEQWECSEDTEGACMVQHYGRTDETAPGLGPDIDTEISGKPVKKPGHILLKPFVTSKTEIDVTLSQSIVMTHGVSWIGQLTQGNVTEEAIRIQSSLITSKGWTMKCKKAKVTLGQ